MVICFDAATFDVVDNLIQSIVDANQWAKFYELQQGNVPAMTPEEHIGQPFDCERGGTVPQKSAVRFNAFLAFPAVHFLNYAHNCFVEGFQAGASAIRRDPTIYRERQ